MIARNLLRLNVFPRNFLQKRSSSILRTLDASPVLVSHNRDIYTNLALEHWLYSNIRFETANSKDTNVEGAFKRPVVLIWTDEPCIVMGRHQNPWVESTVGFLNKAGIKLARRYSGGGCVYHDENNINISIIGDRKLFENRQKNLKFIAKFLDKKYGIKCEPTKRHDLIHSDTGLKISGSAAKLGRFNCYHHFTLLVDLNKEVLYAAIRQNQQDFIQTNSSLSTRSKVINLREIKRDLGVDQVLSDLANAYGELYGDPKIQVSERKDSVEGDEADYQSLNKITEELKTWDWIYGMTPKFKLERTFPITEGGQAKQIKIGVQINKGLFENVYIESNLSGPNPQEKFKYLIGTKFEYKEAMLNISKLLDFDEQSLSNGGFSMGSEKLFATFLLQMVHESNY